MATRDKFSIPDNQRTQIHNDMHRLITGYKYVVMCVLIQHSDKDGYCFPSEKTISGGIASEKTVSRTIAALEKMGYITVDGRKSTSLHTNLSYNINFDKLYTDIESLLPNNKHQTNSPVLDSSQQIVSPQIVSPQILPTPNLTPDKLSSVKPEHQTNSPQHQTNSPQHQTNSPTNHSNEPYPSNHSHILNRSHSTSSLKNNEENEKAKNQTVNNLSQRKREKLKIYTEGELRDIYEKTATGTNDDVDAGINFNNLVAGMSKNDYAFEKCIEDVLAGEGKFIEYYKGEGIRDIDAVAKSWIIKIVDQHMEFYKAIITSGTKDGMEGMTPA